MLLKVVSARKQREEIKPGVQAKLLYSNENIDQVLASVPLDEPFKKEHYSPLNGAFVIHHVDKNNLGKFKGNSSVPSNIGWIIEMECHTLVPEQPHLRSHLYFICKDEEAYIIGDSGQTVTTINSPKSVDKYGNADLASGRVTKPTGFYYFSTQEEGWVETTRRGMNEAGERGCYMLELTSQGTPNETHLSYWEFDGVKDWTSLHPDDYNRMKLAGMGVNTRVMPLGVKPN